MVEATRFRQGRWEAESVATNSGALAVEQAVAVLAERKARAVWTRAPQALVIGSDQLFGANRHTSIVARAPATALARRA